ncbi:MAG: chemotaxis protein CheW [Acidobacteria bacterium]|nr:chemotaxis protein CheW [Acidobacteriota bacterium]
MPSAQFATFLVGPLYFGVEVLSVQEVIRYQSMTPVPRAPAIVKGLINLRGQIVTAIDMRERLGLPPRSADTPPMNVVVRTDSGVVSLLVDAIDDVVEAEASKFEPPPETLVGAVSTLVTGVFKLSGRLLLVLDVATACAVDGGPLGEA